MAPHVSLTYIWLSAFIHLVKAEYRGLLIAVEDRIESLSPHGNTTNTIPGARTIIALSSPPYHGGRMFLTELGCEGPSVYRVEDPGRGHSVLLSPRGKI